jgi:hypothetical protein
MTNALPGALAAVADGKNRLMAMARIQYPCHQCGIMGHWKKDGVCKASDIAAHLQKRMAEQAERDGEEDESSGT